MSQTPDCQLRIFLCHAHEDKDEVVKLYRRLQADGFQPWMDKEDLIPGQDWQVAIRKAVSQSHIFLACISHHSVTKAGFVNREINFALDVAEEQPEDSIFIIPVRLEDSPAPDRLRRWHWCDYFEPDGYQRLLRALHTRAEQLGIPIILPEPQPVEQPAAKPEPLVERPDAKPEPLVERPDAKLESAKPTVVMPDERKKTLSFPALPAFSGWIVAAVAVVLLLVGSLRLSGGGDGKVLPTTESTRPTATEVAVVDTLVPTDTPVPLAATPTNPLFPVTLDEWRTETARSTPQELTRDGDHYWRYVPGGTYKIGGWTDDEQDNNDEATDIELPSYSIAKYPVTVQQYRQFMQAGGYDTREYWTANGWAWKETYDNGKGRTQPFWWDDERFNSDNQPVVGVWWYEATAFAAWLNAELADSLPDGMQVRLPTEAEWEAACAYGSDGQRHTYPWGEQEPSDTLADFGKDWNTDSSALVGERVAGAAANGAQDMVGNVWELTTSEYDTFPGTSGDVVGDFNTSTFVPVRGGAWGSDRTYVRCAARDRHHHDGNDVINGLRLLLLPPR